ncbi:hypothetical protein BCV70DRAFT_121059 [Testicularia cyperi]|uniref:Uncharacterized protein n=1 Tax=Testicularia cyperi TaxID=1882483 RepID=A0A317XKV7_9BASI|nr:hypothetical protein BCV70DRAFT_121059 [Testicularia cyperi]
MSYASNDFNIQLHETVKAHRRARWIATTSALLSTRYSPAYSILLTFSIVPDTEHIHAFAMAVGDSSMAKIFDLSMLPLDDAPFVAIEMLMWIKRACSYIDTLNKQGVYTSPLESALLMLTEEASIIIRPEFFGETASRCCILSWGQPTLVILKEQVTRNARTRTGRVIASMELGHGDCIVVDTCVLQRHHLTGTGVALWALASLSDER